MYQNISEQSIHQYFGDDEPEMITEMIHLILDTNIKDLKELDSFYQQGDLTTIKKRCHKAKPTMVYIGATQTKIVLEEIEKNPGNYHELNNHLQAQLSLIETELNQFLEKFN